MIVPQIVMMVLVLGVGGYLAVRGKARAQQLGTVQPGIDALRAGFAATRADGETEPVCVVAFHYAKLSVEQVTVGVTDRRILVLKGTGTGQVHAFPYDGAGEHLPAAQKQQQQRGFFHWKHGTFKDRSKGYSPVVKQFPPFTGEEWRMYPTLEGFPEQKANLRQFARLFYFQWFYD